jgi:hypothetical protein
MTEERPKAFWRYPFTAKNAPPWFEDLRGYVQPWDDLKDKAKDADRTTIFIQRWLFRLGCFTFCWWLFLLVIYLVRR